MKQYVSKFSGKELDERLTRVDNIPTKTSELNNDSGFISEVEADNKYTDKNKTDVLERDIKDLKDKMDVEIPTKISQLENDKNYITNLDIQNKADLENGKIIASQLPDYILGQVMFGGIIDSGQPTYMNVFTSADFRAKFNYAGEVKRITSSEYDLYNGVYFISRVGGYFLDNDINTGDWIISTGNSWRKVDNSDAVTSVAGLVGHVNASALASVLANIKDSNSLARKTDLPTKLSDLEADIEIGGTSDWNAAEGEEGHIKNRTHYADFVEVDIPEDIASSEVELTIPNIAGVPILVHYARLSTSKYLKISADDQELHVLNYGPAFKIRRGAGNSIFISGHNNESHRLYIATHFVELNEVFLPETIARKSEIATINGQPLTEGGDIEIGGGGSYDDSEIKEILSNIVDEEGYLYSNGEKVDMRFTSAIADKTLTTPNAVGGIAKGAKVSDLEGKTFSEIFDDLLFPTVNPTFTAPTASIAFKSYSSTQEVGANGPTSANFTTGYNAGEIKLNGVKQANRGGTLNSTNSFIYVNGSSSNKTLPTKVTLGSTTFKYRAAYNQGPQPKNNKGGNYDSPLDAGTVDSSAITLNGTYPWYASTSTATSTNPVVKQSLVAWNTTAGNMSTGQFTVQPSGTLPQVFKLPRKLHTLQLKNALNGQMETVTDVSKDYTESTETINIGGTNVTYYVYTYSGSTRGSVTLLAKF